MSHRLNNVYRRTFCVSVHFDIPMHHQMPKFVGKVKPQSGRISLHLIEKDKGDVLRPKSKGVQVLIFLLHVENANSFGFQESDYIADRTLAHSPIRSECPRNASPYEARICCCRIPICWARWYIYVRIAHEAADQWPYLRSRDDGVKHGSVPHSRRSAHPLSESDGGIWAHETRCKKERGRETKPFSKKGARQIFREGFHVKLPSLKAGDE